MSDQDLFIKLSKFAGERFDLTQAGGGNSSVKLSNGSMLIKASGFLLSEVSLSSGYAVVDNKKLLTILDDPDLLRLENKHAREVRSKELVDQTLIILSVRPSIETLLHSLLHKFVLHTHPVTVNAITCRSNWKEILTKLFPECALIDYQTPGLELALELKKELLLYRDKYEKLPEIIFLQNHGLIIASENAEKIYTLYEEVTDRLSDFTGLDLNRYKLTNKISSLINSVYSDQNIAYLSEDRILYSLLLNKRELFFTKPFCPDTFVFCGLLPLELKEVDDKTAAEVYKLKYHNSPKVVVYKEYLFFISGNVKKAREMEDVFKFHVYAASASGGDIQFLSESELKYLGNWEAEKYRQKI